MPLYHLPRCAERYLTQTGSQYESTMIILATLIVLLTFSGIATAQCSSGYQLRGHVLDHCCDTIRSVIVYSCVSSPGSHCNFLSNHDIQCTEECLLGTAAACTADVVAPASADPAPIKGGSKTSRFVETSCHLSRGNKALLSAGDQLKGLEDWLTSHSSDRKNMERAKSGR
jgi:hypothetical protein